MLDFSAFTITAGDWQYIGGLFFCCMLAKFLGSEMRTLLIALVGVTVVDSPAILYIVGLLSIVFRVFDMAKPGGL